MPVFKFYWNCCKFMNHCLLKEKASIGTLTFVRPMMPCLALTYAALKGDATSPCTDDIFTTRPQPAHWTQISKYRYKQKELILLDKTQKHPWCLCPTVLFSELNKKGRKDLRALTRSDNYEINEEIQRITHPLSFQAQFDGGICFDTVLLPFGFR